jgi:hypothetical protein
MLFWWGGGGGGWVGARTPLVKRGFGIVEVVLEKLKVL